MTQGTTATNNNFELPIHSLEVPANRNKGIKTALCVFTIVGCLAMVATSGGVALAQNAHYQDEDSNKTRNLSTLPSYESDVIHDHGLESTRKLMDLPQPAEPGQCDIYNQFDNDTEGWKGLLDHRVHHNNDRDFAQIDASPMDIMYDQDDEWFECPLRDKTLCELQSF